MQFKPDGYYATRNGHMVVRVVSIESGHIECPIICRVHALEDGVDVPYELQERVCFASDGTIRKGTVRIYKDNERSVFDYPSQHGFDLVREVA